VVRLQEFRVFAQRGSTRSDISVYLFKGKTSGAVPCSILYEKQALITCESKLFNPPINITFLKKNLLT
jgi:sulfite exporter TauE/SafE